MVSLDRGIRAGADRGRACLAEWQCRLTSRTAAAIGVLVSGCAIEVAIIAGWLRSFSIFNHPQFFAPGADLLVRGLGDGQTGIDRFVVELLAVAAPYGIALWVAGRARGRGALCIAFAGSVIFGATMLVVFPAGAVDVFHNIMDGRLVWIYHLNAMQFAPSAVPADPLYPALHYWQNVPSAYGPLWFLLTGPAVLAGGNGRESSLIAFKALPFVFELISLGLIAAIVGRIRPERVVSAVILFGWNPLVLWEVVGNGHNDILMMTFVLLAVFLLLGNHWPLAFAALVCSVLVKYVSILLLPIFIVWVLRRRGRSAVVPMLEGLALGIAFAVVVYIPFWSGSSTFAQLQTQQNQIISSPAAALIGSWGEDLPRTARLDHVKLALTLAFALLYLLSLARIRTTPTSLIRVATEAMFLFLVLMTWWFWPWYVVWMLALAALIAGTPHARLAVLFSLTALLVYVSSSWRLSMWNFSSTFAMAFGTAVVVFLTPVLYAIMHVWPATGVIGDP